MESIGIRLNKIRTKVGLPKADIMTNVEPIGKRLKRVRIEAGLSQGEFAKLVNVRRETIGRWERLSHVPNPICLDKLDKLLDEYEIFIGMSSKL